MNIEGPRNPLIGELASLSELLDRTFRGSRLQRGERDIMFGEYSHVLNRENLDHLHVFVDGGRVVAHIGVFPRWMVVHGCRIGTASIGAVATAEEYRGRELASQLFTAAIEQSVREGRPVMPISGGRGLYLRYGATGSTRCRTYEVDRAVAGSLADASVTIRPAVQDDLAVMDEMYNREPVCFVRLPGDLRCAFDRQYASDSPVHFLMVCRGTERGPCAYVIARKNPDEQGRVCIVEAAGDRRAVLGAVSRLCPAGAGSDATHPALLLPVLPCDRASVSTLDGLGVPWFSDSQGTVLVTDPARLLLDLDAYQAERLGPDARLAVSVESESAVFCVGKDRWLCPKREVSRVLLGGAQNDPPVPGPASGAVAEALAALTPIPVPPYGVSYV